MTSRTVRPRFVRSVRSLGVAVSKPLALAMVGYLVRRKLGSFCTIGSPEGTGRPRPCGPRLPVRQIGFVLHNPPSRLASFCTFRPPVTGRPVKLALFVQPAEGRPEAGGARFARHRRGIGFVSYDYLASPGPGRSALRNWVCFAQSSLIPPGPAGKLALFGATGPRSL